jgi:hypothetical protein
LLSVSRQYGICHPEHLDDLSILDAVEDSPSFPPCSHQITIPQAGELVRDSRLFAFDQLYNLADGFFPINERLKYGKLDHIAEAAEKLSF